MDEFQMKEGIWLVERNGQSKTRLKFLKSEDDLEKQSSIDFMFLTKDCLRILSSYLACLGMSETLNSLKLTPQGLQISLPPAHDLAERILCFISLPHGERKKELDRLMSMPVYRETGGGTDMSFPELRQADGALITDSPDSLRLIKEGIRYHEEKARELKEKLEH